MNDSALQWGLIGGALLLVGGAGAAFLMRRRRTDDDQVADSEFAPAPMPRTPVEARSAAPVAMATPYATPVLARTAPAGSVEEMVDSAPSAENPFLTRKNRLRRAMFLMRTEGTPVQAEAAQPTARAQVQTQRAAPTYDFGRGMTTGRKRWLTPATS